MEKNNYMAVFDKARVLYRKYGTVRGNATEFAYFKKTHRDWKEDLPLLEPAIKGQIKQRAKDGRYWKNFKTWIYNRCWEEEYPTRTYSSGESSEQMAERKRVAARAKDGPWLADPARTSEDIEEFLRTHPHKKWLVGEIRSKK